MSSKNQLHAARAAFAFFAAALAGAAAPAVLFGLLTASARLIPIAFLVALVHTLFLGLPTAALLWRTKGLHFALAVLLGFALGSVGIAVFAFDVGSTTTSSIGGVPAIVDGTRTAAGWVGYLRTVAAFGGYGALGGAVFWLWLRWADLPRLHEPADSARDRTARKGPVLLSCLLAAAIVLVPWATQDRSCHNVLRDGGTSASPHLMLDVGIEMIEWPKLKVALASFAESNSLAFRDLSEVRPNVVRTLYLSACNEQFVVMTAEQRWSSSDYRPILQDYGVLLSIFATDQARSIEQLEASLVAHLEEEWPGKVRVRNKRGQLVPWRPKAE